MKSPSKFVKIRSLRWSVAVLRAVLGIVLALAGLTTAHGQQTVADQKPGVTTSRVTARLPSDLSLDLRPDYLFVLPSVNSDTGESRQDFGLAAGSSLSANYRLPGSVLYFTSGLDYLYAASRAATSGSLSLSDQNRASLSLAAGRVGLGFALPFSTVIGLYAYGAGGWYVGAPNDFSLVASNPYVACGLGFRFALDPGFRLSVGGEYKNYFGTISGIAIGLSLDLALGDNGGTVDVQQIRLEPAFPVFYKHYDDHPIGSVSVRNGLRVPVDSLTVQVFVKDYMDSPKTINLPGKLAPGESQAVDLYALFNTNVLSITEGTKVAAEITVSFTIEGQRYQSSDVQTLSILGRNAMTWDDNRKAAAYVNAKDPGVLNFSRSVASYVRAKENRLINDNLVAAAAIHQALDLYGLNYTPNPVTSYETASQSQNVIDFLQFPRETFQYHAGDCSDLSILYASLFQAIGIETAFITVPGHIFVAFDTKETPDQANKDLIPANQYIIHNGHAWIPIEITSRHDGFVKAWELGAKEWNENISSGHAGFWPVQDAWKIYEPVGLPGVDPAVAVPQSDKILSTYTAEIDKWLEQAMAPQVAKLQKQISTTSNHVAMNLLGVLYAKFGKSSDAQAQFEAAVAKKSDYLPALLNLGNLNFVGGAWDKAISWYRRAALIDPGNPQTILALARSNLELKNYDIAQTQYTQLKTLDPQLAAQFAYLGDGASTGNRAADISSERRFVIWSSEE